MLEPPPTVPMYQFGALLHKWYEGEADSIRGRVGVIKKNTFLSDKGRLKNHVSLVKDE